LLSKGASKIKRLTAPAYEVDPEILRRYDQRNLIFNRVYMDPTFPAYGRTMEEKAYRNILEDRSGYTRLDYALSEAAWTVHDAWGQWTSWKRIERPGRAGLFGGPVERAEVKDESEMARVVKRAARFYGASLVGITRVNPLWIYLNDRSLEPINLPEGVRTAIVIAIEMDEMGIATSPACPASAATGLGYSKMAFVASTLAEFIRNLGYTAIPAGNDIALSIPLAVDAGLGQLGRNGLLITPEYGPRVRLCKVLTDLPLKEDKPIDFGVTETCKKCRACAEACEAGAISMDPEPGWVPACSSNNPGVLKWYVNGEKCYEFWCENGVDCSTCIAVCPYNQGPKGASPEDFWRG
jgi:epoxyqueuosine reductase